MIMGRQSGDSGAHLPGTHCLTARARGGDPSPLRLAGWSTLLHVGVGKRLL